MPHRPEVFISATTKDLRTCRLLVSDALLKIGCVPIVQDHFAPDARTVPGMLREKIAACDAVIHLAGECYGFESQERAPGQPRRSFTQMEYDLAIEFKKPLYTFLCAKDFPYDDHRPEEEELRELQRAHRAVLSGGDRVYQPVGDTTELSLRVRELQTRVEDLSHRLEGARAWLSRGVAAALVAFLLVGGGLWVLHRRGQHTEDRVAHAEEKATQVSDELDRYRQAIKGLADRYGKDIEPGLPLTEEEKFDRALAAVAAQQKISVAELKVWMDVFVTQVRANPGADFYDRALADFAQKHFADAAANATKSAAQFRAQREAAETEQAAAGQRAAVARERERSSWTLAADSEYAAGHYRESVAPYRQALELCDEKTEPLVWCDAAQKLEVALSEAGRYAEAKSLALQLVERFTKLLGAEHPQTLNSINSLAVVLLATGDLAGAEPLYRQVLEARERILGKDRRDTLRSVNNLAGLLYAKHDLAAAEPLYRRALEAQERILGPDHPDTLTTVNNLSAVLIDRNDLPAAEPLARRALEAQERTLGRDHPSTLRSVNNLAILLYNQDDRAGAETLFRRALESNERTLGDDHPRTWQSLENLARLLKAKPDLTESERLYRRVLKSRDRTLDKDDPDTLITVINLGLVVAKSDRAGAEPLFRRVLETRERTSGKISSDTATAAYGLSILLQSEGKIDESFAAAEEAVNAEQGTRPQDLASKHRYELHLAELTKTKSHLDKNGRGASSLLTH